MPVRLSTLVVCVAAVAGCMGRADLSVAPLYRSHSQQLTALPTTFTVHTRGRTEPRMLALKLSGPVEDTTVTCDRAVDCTSLEGLSRSIITPGMRDREKALAVWHFVMGWCLRYDGATTEDPLELVNVWGYGDSFSSAALAKALCDASGVKCRVVDVGGYATTEVFWDGSWHMLDAYRRLYFLRRDNRTIASLAHLARDHGLITRVTDDTGVLEVYADDSDDHFLSGVAARGPEGWSPGVTLRPREELIRYWGAIGRWRRSHGQAPPPWYANGVLRYQPDFRAGWENGTLLSAEELKNFGLDPVTGELRPLKPEEPAVLVLRAESPYFIPLALVTGRFRLGSRQAHGSVSVSADGGKSWRVAREASGPGTMQFVSQVEPLRELTRGSPGRYSFLIRYVLESGSSVTDSSLMEAAVFADLQYAPRALPALELGTNTVTVPGTLPEDARATLEYQWIEDLNIALDPGAPRVGLPVVVTGWVTNKGERPAAGVVIRFYEGRPTAGGTPIADDVVIPRLAPGRTEQVRVRWLPGPRASWRKGRTQVWMVVDPDHRLQEQSEQNNATYVDCIVRELPDLVLSDPGFVTVERSGETVTLTAAVRNDDLRGPYPADSEVRNVVVRFFDGDPQAGGRQIGRDRVIPRIAPGEYGYASVEWGCSGLSGTRRVHILVDPANTIPERDDCSEHPYESVVVEVEL